jgi:hypothetical protein
VLDIIYGDPCAVEILDAVKTVQAAAKLVKSPGTAAAAHTAFCRRGDTIRASRRSRRAADPQMR